MNQLTLFISCVSNEFGQYRDALRKDLTRPNLNTKIQEDFIAYGGATLEKLDDYIRQCEAVIHICGDMTGSMANASSLNYIKGTYKDFENRFPELLPVLEGREQLSYTQWEAWLAVYHNKRLIIAIPKEGALRNTSSYKLAPEEQHHQQLHLSRLSFSRDKGNGYYDEIHFSTPDELIKEVYKSKLYELIVALPTTKPISLPYHSIGDLFKGREEVVEELHQRLTNSHTGPTAIFGSTIYGLGGIGKTRLAVEYAWRYEKEYSALLFLVADSPERLFTNLAALCAPSVLDLPEHNVPEVQRKCDAVIQWLNRYSGWLLILDNTDTKESAREVEKLFNQLRGGHVLITSRQANWSKQVSRIPLDILNAEAGVAFLLERTHEDRRKTDEDNKITKLVAEDLGYLALALEQAGAYISYRKLSLAKYRQDWLNNHDQVLDWYDERLMQYPYSVAVTWQTSVNQLSAEAGILLNRLAWLAPDPIPESLLDVKATEGDTGDWYGALAQLAAYSLVSRTEDRAEFTVHRLVQDVTRRKQRKEEDDGHLGVSLNWVNNAFTGNAMDVRDWPVLEPLMPHALALTNYANKKEINTTVTSRLLNQLGLIYLTKAQYQQAEPLMRRALEIDIASFGGNHPSVAIRLNNLAQLLQATNRLAEAEPLMRRALEIDIVSFGENHPNVAIRLNNLAQLLQDTNRLAEAEPLMRRALEIDEQSFGKDHPDVAIDLNNLAQLLQAINRLAEAEPLMRRALEIDEQSFGKDHPDVARDLNNLALLLQATNRLAEAEPLMRRALEIDTASFGENHPRIASELNNLAQLLKATNQLAEAEPLMRRALEIDEQSFGKDHPDVARDLNNLAQLLQDTNRLAEAEPLMRRALEIDIASFGENHPKVAIRLNNLAQLLQATNRLAEAEPLIQRALEIDIASFGENHPKVAIRLNNLAQLLQATNRLAEAEPLMRRALIIFLYSLGFDHPNTKTVGNNYILLLQEMGKSEEEIKTILTNLLS
jgi:tetratricopeptide (TPR) repeat protein